MYLEKTFRPDNLRLPFPTDREAPQATRCDNPKKYSSRQPSAFGQFSAKSLASVRKCTPKRRSGQTTSGCLFPPIARLPKWPAAKARKSTAPDSFQLLVNTSRKTTQVARCDDPKKCDSRLPSAFGRCPAKSPLQRSEMYPEKTFTPDCLRLLVDHFRKISPVTCCDNSKKCSSRLPSAFGRYFAKSSPSLRRCTPKKRSGQVAFGFWPIPRKKSRQRPEICPEKTFTSGSFRLLVNPLQKVSPAPGNVPQPFVSGCRL